MWREHLEFFGNWVQWSSSYRFSTWWQSCFVIKTNVYAYRPELLENSHELSITHCYLNRHELSIIFPHLVLISFWNLVLFISSSYYITFKYQNIELDNTQNRHSNPADLRSIFLQKHKMHTSLKLSLVIWNVGKTTFPFPIVKCLQGKIALLLISVLENSEWALTPSIIFKNV